MSPTYYTVEQSEIDTGCLTTYQTTQLPNLDSIMDKVLAKWNGPIDRTISDGHTSVTIPVAVAS